MAGLRKRERIQEEENNNDDNKRQRSNISLHEALSTNDMHAISELLLRDSDHVNAKNDDGDTVLHIAVRNGATDIIKKILSNTSVNVNAQRGIDEYDGELETPLILAITNNLPDIVSLLLKHDDINVNQRSIVSEHFRPLDLTFDEQVRFTPLYLAAELNYREIVHMLLAHVHIDVHIKNTGAYWNLNVSETPLLAAIINGDNTIIDMILTHTKPKAAIEYEYTPLQVALTHNRIVTVKKLLYVLGYNVNEQNIYDETALHYATDDTIHLLLAQPNIDVFIQDENKQTALDKALDEKNYPIIHAFINANYPNKESLLTQKMIGE